MKRLIIAINEETCIGCGRCVESCPTKALELKDGKAKLKDESLCDGFGSCIAVCPTHSLYLEEREAKPFDWSILQKIDFEEFLDKLVKHYKPKELAQE
ncbi:4Fe-4S ferredoxin iron-sulfur binding domain protein [Ferroglobus placidus DSM 10642]|uniref:4Fe-4S ferredoxin iron-sulfur binding domain protein n=1 Tax=Ferroglobus placidus (strain DSM 10642 / AEDII12DO) TaxID=589924 RepID=D3S112_FERPA|nr:4Fe-4S binding protein [Ferroglobus placidus]ADC64248.1 4Fe-4S ferredoxin iron-sulfur binding domain protein [Ferroglobus placidus DSM 10642]